MGPWRREPSKQYRQCTRVPAIGDIASTHTRTHRHTDTHRADIKQLGVRAQYSPCTTKMIHSPVRSAVLLVGNLPPARPDHLSRDAVIRSRDDKTDVPSHHHRPHIKSFSAIYRKYIIYYFYVLRQLLGSITNLTQGTRKY